MFSCPRDVGLIAVARRQVAGQGANHYSPVDDSPVDYLGLPVDDSPVDYSSVACVLITDADSSHFRIAIICLCDSVCLSA